ncbi:MAG: hypothetical protein ABR521_11290, partial [Gaiellaceae bacterium]
VHLTNTLLRGPVELAQYTSAELTAVMAQSGVLASVGSTGDAYDNAMAESLVDTYPTSAVRGHTRGRLMA